MTNKSSILKIDNLTVSIEGKKIISDVSFEVKGGELISIMGPNGSGKTTLAYAIMGHPKYKVEAGSILLNGEDITNLPPEERSLRGLFLVFQNPLEVRGLKVKTFLYAMMNKRLNKEDLTASSPDYDDKILRYLKELGLRLEHLERDLNVGFSGGERKRLEFLQALLVDPKFIILDEPDSGLDVDGVKLLARKIKEFLEKGIGVILITHYTRLINMLDPKEVIVLKYGKIAARGDKELAQLIEEKSYDAV